MDNHKILYIHPATSENEINNTGAYRRFLNRQIDEQTDRQMFILMLLVKMKLIIQVQSEYLYICVINRQIDGQIDRQTDRYTDRQIDRKIDGQTEEQTYRGTNRQTGGQTDLGTDRQRDRQTEGQTEGQTTIFLQSQK